MGKKPVQIGIIPFVAFYCAAALFLLPWHGTGQEVEPVEVDHTRIANYDIQVSLNAGNHQLAGRESITWFNADGPPTSELWLHLYMNAFRSPDTLFFEHYGGWRREDAGWIDIESLAMNDGQNMLENATIDGTVMHISLPEPVEQGQSVRLDIAFTVQLPRAFARTGYSGDYHMVAQWFPKMGVYLDGRWICPQFHSFSEFFADFGQYRVEITVPRDYEVGATGTRERARTDAATKTLIYTAYPVHDFAWAASPLFRRTRKELTYRDPSGETGTLELNILLHRDHQDLGPAYEEAVRRALEYFTSRYGPFPWPKLVVIDPAPGRAQRTGGMEYPMLITGGASWLDTALLQGDQPIEGVTAHEFGHQYWYGAVASNEFYEAWIDEGLTSFTSDKVIDSFGPFTRLENFTLILGETVFALHPFRWGLDFDFGTFAPLLLHGMKTDTLRYNRSRYLWQPRMDPINVKAARQFNQLAYGVSAYYKPALALLTLENLLGEETMTMILRRFYTEFRFRHPTGEDFRALVSAAAGRDMSWFFEQIWDDTSVLDYEVREIRNGNEVTVVRLGEVIVPQTVEVTLEDGSVLTFQWDPISADEKIWMDEFEPYEGGAVGYRLREGENGAWLTIAVRDGVPVSAQVDPDYDYLLDINYANNSYRVEPDSRMADRAGLSWMRILARWFHGVSAYN